MGSLPFYLAFFTPCSYKIIVLYSDETGKGNSEPDRRMEKRGGEGETIQMRNALNQFGERNRLTDDRLYRFHVGIYTVAERVNCV